MNKITILFSVAAAIGSLAILAIDKNMRDPAGVVGCVMFFLIFCGYGLLARWLDT